MLLDLLKAAENTVGVGALLGVKTEAVEPDAPQTAAEPTQAPTAVSPSPLPRSNTQLPTIDHIFDADARMPPSALLDSNAPTPQLAPQPRPTLQTPLALLPNSKPPSFPLLPESTTPLTALHLPPAKPEFLQPPFDKALPKLVPNGEVPNTRSELAAKAIEMGTSAAVDALVAIALQAAQGNQMWGDAARQFTETHPGKVALSSHSSEVAFEAKHHHGHELSNNNNTNHVVARVVGNETKLEPAASQAEQLDLAQVDSMQVDEVDEVGVQVHLQISPQILEQLRNETPQSQLNAQPPAHQVEVCVVEQTQEPELFHQPEKSDKDTMMEDEARVQALPDEQLLPAPASRESVPEQPPVSEAFQPSSTPPAIQVPPPIPEQVVAEIQSAVHEENHGGDAMQVDSVPVPVTVVDQTPVFVTQTTVEQSPSIHEGASVVQIEPIPEVGLVEQTAAETVPIPEMQQAVLQVPVVAQEPPQHQEQLQQQQQAEEPIQVPEEQPARVDVLNDAAQVQAEPVHPGAATIVETLAHDQTETPVSEAPAKGLEDAVMEDTNPIEPPATVQIEQQNQTQPQQDQHVQAQLSQEVTPQEVVALDTIEAAVDTLVVAPAAQVTAEPPPSALPEIAFLDPRTEQVAPPQPPHDPTIDAALAPAVVETEQKQQQQQRETTPPAQTNSTDPVHANHLEDGAQVSKDTTSPQSTPHNPNHSTDTHPPPLHSPPNPQ
eukprot:c15706_g1_i1.p1 GENE.c15706_g1_i1~~c15706_g1_i1.p1  ORF type:complete len:756 (-),score=183.88 c15706_g1_i1:76-2232(-)